MTVQTFVKEKLEDGFTDIQGLAWSGFLRMQAQLLRTLNAELRAEHGITLSEYEVLLFLDWPPISTSHLYACSLSLPFAQRNFAPG